MKTTNSRLCVVVVVLFLGIFMPAYGDSSSYVLSDAYICYFDNGGQGGHLTLTSSLPGIIYPGETVDIEITFDEVKVCQQKLGTLTFENASSTEVDFGPELSGDSAFTLSSNLPGIIYPGETIDLEVTFSPPEEGYFEAICLIGAQPIFRLIGTGAPLGQNQPQVVIGQLQQIVEANPDTDRADEIEDALTKALTAHFELTKSPPDNQAAAGDIERAVADLESAVENGLLDAGHGIELLDILTDAAWLLAVEAYEAAVAAEADPEKIAEAEQAFTEGGQHWFLGEFKKAVDKYKDALAILEGAIGMLVELVTQDLVSEDGQQVGKVLFYYYQSINETDIELSFWDLPNTPLHSHLVRQARCRGPVELSVQTNCKCTETPYPRFACNEIGVVCVLDRPLANFP